MTCFMGPRFLFFLVVTLSLVAANVTALEVHRPAFLARKQFTGFKLPVGPPQWSGKDYCGDVVLASGMELCSNKTSIGNWKGAIVLSLENKCNAVDQAVVAQNNGALGLLIANSKLPLALGGTVQIPVEVLPKSECNAITATIKQGISVRVSIGHSLNVLRFAI
ncbi:hypothetical protein TraAM80_01449 [Trypanosoma rangeli]|uniref:PA domain-containing protein n=1 Tax=Trypanosoma rangeli TaxID=5698 RepID=A0A422NYQ6_TRYRA|nr:uncharacterized protein TraAM80_01449 [Trypanosoma rangeli]RNF10633.1 hypothetical protein TraAM80_01449 [Trypanosoma rangeli]|eukprot:RNF10633.1 hypothetical protein TraAM80_01449 [Trypanosoma rangeli]